MSNSNHYDVIIIGSGAGGGTLAYAIAPSNKKILILERGDYIPVEKDNWNPKAVFLEQKYKAKETWYDIEGNPFSPGIYYNVGGNTKFYGAALIRMRKEDFGEILYPQGISPAWPITYDEFEPYYLKAEKLYQVHGLRGEDPTEPPSSGPYPFPPVSHEPYMEDLAAKFQKLGYSPTHLPLGLFLDEKDRVLSTCIKCNTCDGFPCMLHAKADAYTCGIRPALKYPNVTLHTNSYVIKLVTSPSGSSINRIIVNRNNQQEEYTADIVVSSCGAVNSAALFLRSHNDKHPNGLANGSGMVGRNYMGHAFSTFFLAYSQKLNPTNFQKTMGLHDFYFGSPNWPYPHGTIQVLGKITGDMIRGRVPKIIPKKILDYIANRSVAFSATIEDLPLADNRIFLDKNGRINLHYTKHNREGHEKLVILFKKMLKDVGLRSFTASTSIADVAHQCGTLRFGRDPQTSVLDVNCKAHEIDNLYVVDSSFFVSSAAMNPALTIIANSLRVGDHLLERLKMG